MKKENKINITINNKKYQLDNRNKNILEIYLFGSVARNENDKFSDLDIFILCVKKEENLKQLLANKFEINPKWLSIYTIDEILIMYKKGSLFLWHLKKEAKRLYSKNNWLSKKLNLLPSYKGIGENLVEYQEILFDIKRSFSRYNNFEIYEINLIATLMRNIAILHCYFNGYYIFGRNSAFIKSQILRKKNNIIELDLYIKVYNYRIAYKEEIIDVELKKINIAKTIEALEKYLKEVVEEYGKKRVRNNRNNK